MYELKPLRKEGIPKALEKADRYRLLNEPALAASICLDVLETDHDNQRALVMLILALTDQFGEDGVAVAETHIKDLLPKLVGDYEQAYYAGVVCERRAKASMKRHLPGSVAYEWFRQALEWYEKAEPLRPEDNDEVVLRWNTCARLLNRNPNLQPAHEDGSDPYFD